MWDTNIFNDFSPTSIGIPYAAPLHQLFQFSSNLARSLLEEPTLINQEELIQFVDQSVFESTLPSHERLIEKTMLWETMDMVAGEDPVPEKGHFLTAYISQWDTITKIAQPIYQQHQVLALICLNLLAQAKNQHLAGIYETNSNIVNSSKTYREQDASHSVYYLSENSTYEEFLQTAVEILSYAMSVHGVELGRTKHPIQALKSISEMAKSAANIRHQPSKTLKIKFITWYLENDGTGLFQSQDQAANKYYDSLPSSEQIYQPHRAATTLCRSLWDYKKGKFKLNE